MRGIDGVLATKVQSGHNGLDTKEVGGNMLRVDWNILPTGTFREKGDSHLHFSDSCVCPSSLTPQDRILRKASNMICFYYIMVQILEIRFSNHMIPECIRVDKLCILLHLRHAMEIYRYKRMRNCRMQPCSMPTR